MEAKLSKVKTTFLNPILQKKIFIREAIHFSEGYYSMDDLQDIITEYKSVHKIKWWNFK